MEKRALWFLVVVLTVVDFWFLSHHNDGDAQTPKVSRVAQQAAIEAAYADEEELLLNKVQTIPNGPLRSEDAGLAGNRLEFYLIVSARDCTNCIEDEVSQLNRLVKEVPKDQVGVEGFFVDESEPEIAQRVMNHLAPEPQFPVRVRSVLEGVAASTPLVLVVRVRDGRILDAHKPLPENLSKRDAFYARWNAVLGIG